MTITRNKLVFVAVLLTTILGAFIISGMLATQAHLPQLGERQPAVETANTAIGTSDRIAIPAINVDTVLVNTPRVGNTWDTSILTSQVGHMEGTAFPGQGNNVVLVAHRYLGIRNGQPSNPGPFAALDRLKAGDAIQVAYGGTLYTYTMTENFQITRRDAWVINGTSSEMVTLMSCDGWNPATQTYDLLLVVRGTLTSVQPLAQVAAQAPAPVQMQAPVQPAAVMASTTTDLRVRSGPSTMTASLGVARAGTTVAVVGRNTTSNWLLVEANGTRGWVAAWYAVVNGDINTVPVVAG